MMSNAASADISLPGVDP